MQGAALETSLRKAGVQAAAARARFEGGLARGLQRSPAGAAKAKVCSTHPPLHVSSVDFQLVECDGRCCSWDQGAVLPQEKERVGRPEDVVRALDTRAALLTELSEVAARLGGVDGERLLDSTAAQVNPETLHACAVGAWHCVSTCYGPRWERTLPAGCMQRSLLQAPAGPEPRHWFPQQASGTPARLIWTAPFLKP